jgi:hypothetical protein
MDDIVVVKVVMPMVIWRKLFEARTELEAHLLSRRGGRVIHISFDGIES